MRTLHVIVISLGLGLIVFSSREIEQVRQYRMLVSQVQGTANESYHKALKLRPANVSILISPSMDSVLSELDSANKFEEGWRVAGGIGCVVCVLGLAGFVLGLRTQKAANNSLQATAAPPRS